MLCLEVNMNFLLHGIFYSNNNRLSYIEKAGVFAKNNILYKCKMKMSFRRIKMKFLKNNILSIMAMTLLFTLVMIDNSSAASVFESARGKLVDLFKNAKMVVFVIGGFGLIALAFQAIFGKVKWPWFAALAFGLAVVAAAGAIVNYAANTDGAAGTQFGDSMGEGQGSGFNSGLQEWN